MEAEISSRAFRNQRLRLAISSSAISKVLGAAAQFVSLSLVAHTLGTPRYASYLAVTASVAWVSLLGFGFAPALTFRLAQAAARNDRAEEAALVGAGVWIALSIGSLLVLVAAAIGFFGTDAFIHRASASANPSEVRLAFVASLVVFAVHFLASTSTAIRAGYQESHLTNRMSAFANLFVLVGAWAASASRADIATFIVAIYAPFTALFLYDFVRIFRTRRYLWPITSPIRTLRSAEATTTLFGMFRTTSAMQLANFLIGSGMVVLVSHLERSTEAAEFGSLIRFMALAISVISLVSTPLLPAVVDAVATAQISSVRHYYRRAVSLTLVVAGVLCTVLAVSGPKLFAIWLGRANAPPQSVCAIFGLYLIVSMSNLIHSNFALALNGTRRIGMSFLVQAALAYALAIYLTPSMGNLGAGLALLASSAALNGWMLPLSVRQTLAGANAEPVDQGALRSC